jgi:hypothetical protein
MARERFVREGGRFRRVNRAKGSAAGTEWRADGPRAGGVSGLSRRVDERRGKRAGSGARDGGHASARQSGGRGGVRRGCGLPVPEVMGAASSTARTTPELFHREVAASSLAAPGERFRCSVRVLREHCVGASVCPRLPTPPPRGVSNSEPMVSSKARGRAYSPSQPGNSRCARSAQPGAPTAPRHRSHRP